MTDVLVEGYIPDIPDEIWLLRNSETGQWVVSADYYPEGNAYLACFSERDAKFAALYQFQSYGVRYEPVRVK